MQNPMSYTVDLGSSIFNATRSGHCIFSKALATFLLPENALALPPNIKQMISSKVFWITQGRELTLDFSIQGSYDVIRSIGLDHFITVLREAELWSDLGLVVAMKSYKCQSDFNSTMTIHFCLALREDIKRIIKGMHGKVPRPIRRQISIDPQPPPGIARIALSNIRVFFDVHTTLKLGTRRTILAESFQKSSLAPGIDSTKYREGKRSLIICLRYGASTASTVVSQSDLISSRLCRGASEFLCFRMADSTLETSPVTDGDNRKLHGLLDCAIRSLISANPSKVAPGVGELNFRERLRLSDIAPSVFSPGYHDAIRQRTGFLPGIAKSIESIVKKSASKRIQDKCNILERSFEKNHGSALDNSVKSEQSDLRSKVKCLLWTSLQKGLYDPSAARKLSPIRQIDSTVEYGFSVLEDQLPITWSDDDLLSAGLDIDLEYLEASSGQYDDIYDLDDDYERSLFGDELLTDSTGDSGELTDAICQFSVSDHGEEGLECSVDDEPASRHQQVHVSSKTYYDSTTLYDDVQQYRRSLSIGFPTSPLTLNEDMLSPSIDARLDPELDYEPLDMFEQDLFDERYHSGDEAFDEEMLY